MEPTLFVLIGVSYSGKSTVAKRLAEANGAVIVSTDAIRGELYGDESDQTDGAKVFRIAYERVAETLDAGRNVVFDATNLRVRARKKLLRNVKNIEHGGLRNFSAVAIVVATPPMDVIMERMTRRERFVPIDVVERQAKAMQMPGVAEGFDAAIIVKEGWTDEADKE